MMNRLRARLVLILITGTGLALEACGSETRSPSPVVPTLISAGPTGTHTLSGIVSETGDGPLAGVSVTTILVSGSAGPSAQTERDGSFTLTGMPYAQSIVNLIKDGYEPRQIPHGPTSDDTVASIKIQPLLQMRAGQGIDPTLFSDDLEFLTTTTDVIDGAGELCGAPCKMIRVSVPSTGNLDLRADWDDPSMELGLYARPLDGLVATGVTGSSPLRLTASVAAGTWVVLVGAPNKEGRWYRPTPPRSPLRIQLTTALRSLR